MTPVSFQIVGSYLISTFFSSPLLILSIFLNWLIKPSDYLLLTKGVDSVASSLVLSLPLLFAGIIFASSFKKSKDVSSMFAYNLLGAILGGFCEYISMITGFSFLLIIAMLIYGLSYIGLRIEDKIYFN